MPVFSSISPGASPTKKTRACGAPWPWTSTAISRRLRARRRAPAPQRFRLVCGAAVAAVLHGQRDAVNRTAVVDPQHERARHLRRIRRWRLQADLGNGHRADSMSRVGAEPVTGGGDGVRREAGAPQPVAAPEARFPALAVEELLRAPDVGGSLHDTEAPPHGVGAVEAVAQRLQHDGAAQAPAAFEHAVGLVLIPPPAPW